MHQIVKEHRWIIADPPDAGIVAALAKDINVPESIAKVLVYRGITDYDKAKEYFRPSLISDITSAPSRQVIWVAPSTPVGQREI